MLGVYTPNSPFYDKEKIKTRVSNNAHAQGVGRHTDEEVGEMIRHDLTMLSEILGEGAFSIWAPSRENLSSEFATG